MAKKKREGRGGVLSYDGKKVVLLLEKKKIKIGSIQVLQGGERKGRSKASR